ncbi:GrlR family regulatory protein [Stutzerimonas nitrititolerans]|uniref:GrlR family regulatory protein n=1 Tax=Stutzerimonas nitrititolerans TaxID=2482751 RepID=UPI0028A0F089|nr:GrlR family regulatory protein [Stutzerimonas nitrititolerans]
MNSGIFEVSFRSSIQDFGEGLVVIKDGTVNGGDAHYLYTGQFAESSGTTNAKIKVQMWKAGSTSIVNIDNYELDLTGTIDFEHGALRLRGQVVGQPSLVVSVEGRKIADAA